MTLSITHIGGPTTLIEIGGVRLLVDPTFDAPGRRYAFGWGTSSRKTAGPAVPAADLGPLDGILLTHDQHADNLDDAGRALLPSAPVVVTTPAGARRLGGVGLTPWQTTTIGDVEVTATPSRHGPAWSVPIVGPTTGFALRPPGSTSVVWISGDTVVFPGVLEVASRLTVDTAVLHLGKVQFGLTGPARFTMTGRDAYALCTRIKPRRIIPVHYEGWSHFHEGRAQIDAAFPPDTLTWLTPGTRTTFASR
ncbi:MBL fold metallo-hydrolase [Paractinoplanes abujensis]|uniref:L-ascorbate metabolism protein UlaG (Beta-lactamase superfamily) n=1 Tax=Paractinoplanes abujensis TaxID=882441 RepID=A0A7W7D1F4_9ACTN|nr:MBL fold metallo-hydrolase [Actinoplanes abujensis]MBB4697203.1 L-ascorbate metabolism protein UlaG (beta-lactamase superfamily) [Actinoplanes abujensis]GID18324.1 MBL fold metallo-hydrolase [Actinoplanes abujensis]